MTELTKEEKIELRKERRQLINLINSYIRIINFQTDAVIQELEKAAERIKEIEALIGYKPRKARPR